MTTAAVIVAAGRGRRAGGRIPKQWRMLGGRAMLAWSLEAFRNAPVVDRVVLVMHESDMGLAPGYAGHSDVTVVTGGETRAASVRAGLEALGGSGVTRVLIHDVARPLVSRDLITRVTQRLESAEGAAPGLPITDALWRAEGDMVAQAVDRSNLWRAQTPQGFRFEQILQAHRTASFGGAADDVEIARAAGLDVAIVPGEESNLKVTLPEDFAKAERILEAAMDVRCGSGFDVHRFGPGDRVVLCGVPIPHSEALVGHSDADVGIHAITDAIYGALAEGDIGRHFPPSDPGWAGADSRIFLEHAAARAAARGFSLSNVDCTLICEAPKIGPHADDMVATLANTLEIEPGRISVKATTAESLGFTGRREGIAAMATITLVAR